MRPRRSAPLSSSFREVLLAIQGATGWTQPMLAERFGISVRTLTRYTAGEAVPPPSRRHGIVHALGDLHPTLLARVVASLGVAHDFPAGVPIRPVVLHPDVVRQAVDAAVIEAAERVDAGPIRTRLALATFLDRMAARGIDVATARTALGAATTARG
jgi:hypothetical protein